MGLIAACVLRDTTLIAVDTARHCNWVIAPLQYLVCQIPGHSELACKFIIILGVDTAYMFMTCQFIDS